MPGAAGVAVSFI